MSQFPEKPRISQNGKQRALWRKEVHQPTLEGNRKGSPRSTRKRKPSGDSAYGMPSRAPAELPRAIGGGLRQGSLAIVLEAMGGFSFEYLNRSSHTRSFVLPNPGDGG